jgi:hypothetical protein
MEETKNIACPLCKYKKINPKNLGFVNCKWIYRLIFLDKKDTCNTGDGFTIDNNIYILNEIDMNKSIRLLEILVQEREIIKKKKEFRKKGF